MKEAKLSIHKKRVYPTVDRCMCVFVCPLCPCICKMRWSVWVHFLGKIVQHQRADVWSHTSANSGLALNENGITTAFAPLLGLHLPKDRALVVQ